MSKQRKNKRGGRGGQKAGVGKRKVEASDEDIELYETFKMLNEQADQPDPGFYNEEDNYDFPVLSVRWWKDFEAHIKDGEPFPSGTINEDILDSHIHNRDSVTYKWGEERLHYNQVLKRKMKFRKDYFICTEAAWETLRDSLESHQVVRRFYLTDKGWSQCNPDYETVLSI
jgi:hypothetical protein